MTTMYRSPRLVLPVDPERDHVRGPVDAPITLLEYGDFECPYCGAAHPIVEALREHMGDELRFVFRQFPLVSIHPHAERAAEAAEAAGAQGRFWEMHDRLFEHQHALDDESFLVHAEAVGLDLPRFAREMAGGTHASRVREDFMSGVRSGVNGTPSFYIDGMRHDGPWDLDSLVAAIEYARGPRQRRGAS
jgi:protein-disulfide isomerase